MGREKIAALSTKEVHALAKVKADAPPPEPEAPKRRLNRIRTGVVTAKETKVLTFGGAGAGGEWTCHACAASCFASRTSCFKCNEPRAASTGGASDGKVGGGCKGGGSQSGSGANAAKGGGSQGGSGINAAKSGGSQGGTAGGGSGADAGGSDSAGIVLKEWQRLPKALLQEYCDRAKLPRPRYTSSQQAGGMQRVVVWMNDPKDPTGKSDQRFQPPDVDATAQDAQHRAALYALFGVGRLVQHHLKLPEPYRTIWLELGKTPPTPGSKSAGGGAAGASGSSAGAGSGPAGRGGGGSGGGRSGDDGHARGGRGGGGRGGSGDKSGKVTLSEGAREAAQRAIMEARGGLWTEDRSLGDSSISAERHDDAGSEAAVAALSAELLKLGFGADAAKRGARQACAEEAEGEGGDHRSKPLARRLRDSALDWLFLSLPESELPLAFTVKARVQIVRPRSAAPPDAPSPAGAGLPTADDDAPAAALQTPDRQAPVDERTCAVSSALAGGVAALLALLEPFASEAAGACGGDGQALMSDEEARGAAEEELAVAESIYGDNLALTEHAEGGGLRCLRLAVEGADPPGSIVVLLRARYPLVAALPVFEPTAPFALSPAEQLSLCRALAAQAARLAEEGSPAVHELCASIGEAIDNARIAAAAACDESGSGCGEGSESEREAEGTEAEEVVDAAVASGGAAHAPRVGPGRKGAPAAAVGAAGQEGRGGQAGHPLAPRQNEAALRRQSERLSAEQHRLEGDKAHSQMRSQRASLPAYGSRVQLLAALDSSRVLVVCGETGCGKSTQVPQYLLEEAVQRGRGGEARIIVTQPRRIAAISLAERVAAERGNSRVGDVVGYAVRLDSRQSASTRLLFCTTGVLLQQLKADARLSSVTHVVVDEVHERSLDSDFLLTVLRDALAVNPRLRVVLMSATLDASLFASYFGGCAVLNIPGRTFPIVDFTIEDAVEATGYVARGRILLKSSDADRELRALEAEPTDEPDAAAGADGAIGGEYSERTRQALLRLPAGNVPADLIARLIAHLDERDAQGLGGGSSGGGGGAVLIFLPGVAEIRRLASELGRCEWAARWLLLPLHGELPPDQQRKVFGRPPRGLRKVVLATNVAETSLTIDDVRVVIDTGRVKLTQYDALNATAQLVETWAPLSSRRQRRGRAGRTSEGEYWGLYSRAQLLRLHPTISPEIARVPLDNLFLQVKALGLAGGDARAFLRRALEPPSPAALDAAEKSLVRVGALLKPSGFATARVSYGLSPLGEHLARMPLDLRVGKMLLYGAMLGCVDPVLTIAAAMSLSRPPFLSPMDQRSEANAARAHLCAEMSDQLALLRAYEGWARELNSGGAGAARRFSTAHFLSANGMEELHGLRAQLANTLGSLGLPKSSAEAAHGELAGVKEMHQVNLVRALLCAGLYPSIAVVRMPDTKFEATAQGAVETANEESRAVKFYTLPDGASPHKRVFLHPSSALFGAAKFESNQRWLVFHSRQQQANTDRVYLRDVTAVSPLALLLFGGEVTVDHDRGQVTVDAHITFDAPGQVAVLVRELRAECDKILRRKIENPALEIRRHPVLATIVRILSTEDSFA